MKDKRLYLETDNPSDSVLLDRGRVQALGVARPPNAARLDCRSGRIQPGFVNAHTHLYSGLAPLGMPEPESPPRNFVEILERVWWRLDRALDERSLRAAARYYIAEALLRGTTTVVDHHESPHFIEGSLDVLANACEELGMRALLCYGATERNGGRREAERGLGECRRFIAANQREQVRALVGVHAAFTVSDDTIREAGALCRETRNVAHVHVAEDKADVDDALQRGYRGPLERLMELDALPPGSVLAHGVHLSEEQVERAAGERFWLVQNPRSNQGNRVGYPQALSASHRVALGTDGYPSDMLAEETALLDLSQARDEVEKKAARNRLEAGQGLLCERFGAIFGLPSEGTVADLIVIDETQTLPRHVIVDGRPVVRDGVLQTAEIDDVRDEARQEAERLWERMKRI